MDKHKKQIDSFIDLCYVPEVNKETATHYAKIKSLLKKKGKPIPENDIWIASLAK